tara:strand:+ start:188 stop:493 length:306 start_codon:yes stop_codon:yes gene_type:complete
MKKLLYGLVIAVMMTGSVYSREPSKDLCKWLKENAVNLSLIAYAQGQTADKLMHESIERSTPEGKQKLKDDDYLFKLNRKGQLKDIKDAHYYAVTWSALCD